MKQPDYGDISLRLRAIEDELAIRNLVARFTDAVNERDRDAFRQVWTENAIWENGPPRPHAAEGVDAIVDMFDRLLASRVLFIQRTHSGIIDFTGADTATARFIERERGRGSEDYYENLAVYQDVLVRTPVGWRFKRRYYNYRFLDVSAFPGEVIPIMGKLNVAGEGKLP